MTDTAMAGEPFRIGACLSRTLSVYFGNFIRFNLLGLLIMGPGVLLLGLLLGAVLVGFSVGSPDSIDPVGMVLSFVISFVLILGFQYFLTGVLVYATLQSLRGEKPSFGGALLRGLRRIVPIVGVAVITTVLVWIGVFFFLIPGVIVALMLCVAIPAVMVEDHGILSSLSRSRALTKGARWQLFGLFLVGFLGSMAVSLVVGLPFGILAVEGSVLAIIGEVIQFVLQLALTVFLAVLLAVAYHDLRVSKEGVSTAQLAAVFD